MESRPRARPEYEKRVEIRCGGPLQFASSVRGAISAGTKTE